MRSVVAAILFALASAVPAFAQSTVVGAAFIGNILRSTSSSTDIGSLRTSGADGESIGGALALSRALGNRWGVEAEFALPAEIERDDVQDIVPLLTEPIPLPSFSYGLHSRQKHTTIGAALWFRQSVGRRASLVYLGGVSFARVRREVEFGFGSIRLPSVILPVGTTTVTYTTGPIVGIEARIPLASRAFLVPGFRLHGVGASAGGGWLLRPGIGLAWGF